MHLSLVPATASPAIVKLWIIQLSQSAFELSSTILTNRCWNVQVPAGVPDSSFGGSKHALVSESFFLFFSFLPSLFPSLPFSPFLPPFLLFSFFLNRVLFFFALCNDSELQLSYLSLQRR